MRHVVSGLVALLVLAAVGCEVVGPMNQFDPQTPADQQAPGTVVGRVFLDGRDLNALPVQISTSSKRPRSTTAATPALFELSMKLAWI